ncbi:MAG TPA: ABC transporter substrate-binding protein, partial [Anaerolineae bacterium]|nr:ABC transporter substrate-binding protein [Anaerolineae bacterium]
MKRINRRISSNLIIIAILSLLWGCSQTSATTPQPADSSTTEVEAAAAPPTGEATGSQVASGQTDSEAAAALPASVVGDPDAVTILVADKITSLDPYQMALNNSTRSIAAHIWDNLTRLNDDLVVEPHLAESWRLVNNLTWEFKLRPGVSFHNGEPVNAEAVRFSIERSQSNSNSLET